MTPNSTRILQRWGLSGRLWREAAEPTALTVHRYTGKVLAHEDNFHKNIRRKYQAPFLDMHRVDLQLSLYDKAKELGIGFQLGEKVDSIDFDQGEIVTEAGTKARADIIVAADGLWSKCQTCFLGKQVPPLPTGDLAYRVVLDLAQVEDDPELSAWVSNPTVHFWIGPGTHVVGYSMRAGKMYNLVLLSPDDLPEGVSRKPGNLEEMKAYFAEWDPILRRFLEKVDSVEKWRLMHSMYRLCRRPCGKSCKALTHCTIGEELPSWVNDKSNLVFV